MWIILSLISTFSQIVRNLLSKELTKELPIRVISLSRFLFALPIVFISYLILSGFLGKVTLINAEFYFWIILMAISQILATLFRISLFNYKSFAVSLTIVQIDGVFTALLALAFLGETLSLTAWIGVMTASTGLILATLSKNSVTIANIKRTLFTKASLIALLTGLFLAFVITSYSIHYTKLYDLEKIAGEKAGIIKEKTPIVTSNSDTGVVEVIKTVAKSKNSEFYTIGENFLSEVTKEGTFLIESNITYPLGIQGFVQPQNALLAIKAVNIAAQ